MSNELFLRAASLKVGSGPTDTLLFDQFRITFDIDKNSESAPNQARVSVYGIDADTRQQFQDTEKLKMEFQVGYLGLGGGPPFLDLIFTGDVRTVRAERSGADIVTSFDAGDGEAAIQTAKIDKTFAEATSTTSVLGTLTGALKGQGITMGNIVPKAIDFFKNGLTLSGPVNKQLDTVTQKLGLEWNITDNVLNILEPGQTTTEVAVVVSKSTGLVGVPTRITGGIEFVSLLNTKIKPGVRIIFESALISGQYKCRRAQYVGDTHHGTFQVKVEALEVKPGAINPSKLASGVTIA